MTKGHIISSDVHVQIFSSVAALNCLWQNLALNGDEQKTHSYGEKRPMGNQRSISEKIKEKKKKKRKEIILNLK